MNHPASSPRKQSHEGGTTPEKHSDIGAAYNTFHIPGS